MKKIALVGGFGYADIGDEAQLTADLINLRKFIPDVQLLVLSETPEYIAKYHKCRKVQSAYSLNHYLTPETNNFFSKAMRKLKLDVLVRAIIVLFNILLLKKVKKTLFLNNEGQALFNNLKSADLLFNTGGGNITSCWPYQLYSKCLTYLVCNALGKPIILSGQTIGPFTNWFDRQFARFALDKVDVITLRDTTSKGVLNKIGVTKPVIKETADDATLLPCITPEKIRQIFHAKRIPENHLLIGMNTLNLKILSSQKVEKAKQILAEVADHLISTLDARIVFIPTQYTPGSDDRVTMSGVVKLMKHKDKVSIIMNEYDDMTLKGIIGQMDLAIGLRYHFIVFATTMHVPSLGIYLNQYYSMKIKGILELMGLEKYACDIEKTSSREIITLINHMLSNKDAIEKKLEERTRLLGETSLFTIRYASKLLKVNE